MSGKNINFNDKKIKKSDFYKNKKINRIDDIDVSKIFVSKKEPYGTKSSFKNQQNNNPVFDLFKVSKIITKFLTCSKSAK